MQAVTSLLQPRLVDDWKSVEARLLRRVRLLEDHVATQAMLDSTSFDLERFMQVSCDRLVETTTAEGAVVELVDGDEMVYRAATAALRGHIGVRLDREGSLSGQCVREHEILACEDVETDARVDRAACRRIGIRSMLCAPLFGEEGAVGVLKLVAATPSAFGADDRDALVLAAGAIGAALGRQLRYSRQAKTVLALEAEIQARERLEFSLKTNEAQLARVISRAHHAIITLDAWGRVLGWNPFAARMFGWSAEEAIGRDAAVLIIPPQDRKRRRRAMNLLRRSAATAAVGKRTEWMAARRTGEEFPVEIAISGFEGAQGWEFTLLMHDISERRAKTELFEAAFQHAAIGMALVGLDGAFLKVNPALRDLLGYSEQELLSRDFQAITHPDDLQADMELLHQLLARAIPSYRMDKRYIRADGSQVWAHLNVSIVFNADGSPGHFISQIEDHSARVAAETALKDSEIRYRLIAENTSDMVVTSDLKGRITFMSAACDPIMGCSSEMMLGRSPLSLAHPDDVETVVQVFKRVFNGDQERVRWRAAHQRDERWVWLESNPSLLCCPNTAAPIGFIDVIRDITGQVAQEEALDAARAEAEAATAVKSEFLANMSHEIRTPLTAVLGFSSLLSERADLDETARMQVHRISTASKALLSIVNDVLDFSKLEAGQFEISRRIVSPAEVARDALVMFTPQADARGLELACEFEGDLPDHVEMDPDRFRQILLNLIGNAVKFTDKGSVRLGVAYDFQRQALRVRVTDTGAGMTADQRLKLFQRFSQVDASSTRKHGGTGLGLAICKGLIEAMGGEVGVDSTPGEGSSFHFHILAPLAEAVMDIDGPDDAAASVEGVRVLVVDDNSVNRELARAVLEAVGVEVTEASDGLSGAETAREQPFDLILLDVNMPGLSGVETLALIRAQPGPNQNMPILAFTAAADLARLDGRHGFNGVVRKPIVPMELIESIDRWTTSYEADALTEAG